jgi:hypothetical protein
LADALLEIAELQILEVLQAHLVLLELRLVDLLAVLVHLIDARLLGLVQWTVDDSRCAIGNLKIKG